MSGKEIVCWRVLRQRDPLSSLLFVIIVDGLYKMMENSKKTGLLSNLPGSSSGTPLNLQYADNTLIFSQNDIREAIIIKCVLWYFEVWSGLNINFYKSSVISLERDPFIIKILQCKQEVFPIICLGIPVKPTRLMRRDWHHFWIRYGKKLEGWRGRLLSVGEKLILLNAVLSMLSLYYMFFFILPRWVREKIEKK